MKKKITFLVAAIVFCCAAFTFCDVNAMEFKGEGINIMMNDLTALEPDEEILESAAEEYTTKMDEWVSVTEDNLMQWYLEFKEMIDRYPQLDPPETIYDYYSDSECDLLFRVVQAEVGDEYSFIQKCNVASVILNRIDHDDFDDMINEILIESQFESISDGRYNSVEVSDETILACEYAFQIEDTTDGALFFDSNGALNYTFLFNDGTHNFYTITK